VGSTILAVIAWTTPSDMLSSRFVRSARSRSADSTLQNGFGLHFVNAPISAGAIFWAGNPGQRVAEARKDRKELLKDGLAEVGGNGHRFEHGDVLKGIGGGLRKSPKRFKGRA
jgi:hypothetical protein